MMRITEKKRIKIDRGCKDNPVYLSWLNVYGGREHWLFHKVQTHGLVTGNGGTFEPYISDLENSRGQINDITKTGDPILIVNARVDIEDILGIKTLLYSPIVEMLMNPLTWSNTVAPVWQTVRPEVGSFKIYDTDESKATIQITLDLPYINIQSK